MGGIENKKPTDISCIDICRIREVKGVKLS